MSALTDLIDISVALQTEMPTWPGSPGFKLESIMNLENGEEANVSCLEMDIHTGTHIDAPHHFIQSGATVEAISLNTLVGSATVVELPEAEAITAEILQALQIPAKTSRLLFHTRNSNLWQQGITQFQKDFVALTTDAAQWIVDHRIQLVGVDYLSVQRFYDSPLTHEILLKAGVVIVEGLNLSGVRSGIYQLICLPLKLIGAEGAPARAVLIPQE